jgi:SAM-dependent methyltransferase
MRNSERWFPTKYELKGQKLRGSRNKNFLSVSSRLMADITASFYQENLPKYAKGRLIDLGCGNIPFYGTYRDLINENICVDWPNSGHKNEYLDFECDLNQQLPFHESEFDTIIISEVLEHISNPELTWSEMARILKPGGRIILSVPFLYKIHEAPYDYFRYTEFALKNFAAKNHLQVLELKNFGGLPEVLTDIISKKLVQFRWVGVTLASLLQRICFSFVKSRYGRKISSNTGVSYPLGYFMVVEKLKN